MKISFLNQVADPELAPTTLPQAVLDLDQKIADMPRSADLWLQRGFALSDAKLFRKSVEAFSRAIALEPFNGTLYRHRGHRHLSCWEFQEAEADFIIASRIVPKNWDVWYHLGLSHFLTRRYEDAAEAYRVCLSLSDGQSFGNLCGVTDWYYRTLLRLGQKETAATLLAKLPPDFQYEGEGLIGYERNCALYQGRIASDDVLTKEVRANPICYITSAHAVSLFYSANGEQEKADKTLDELLAFGKEDWWFAFGYLAALADKWNRDQINAPDGDRYENQIL